MKIPTSDAVTKHTRIQAMCRVFTLADRILSGEKVICKAVEKPDMVAPAFSDGVNITFNTSRIHNIVSIQDIVEISGFNYHELSHVLYTPRLYSIVGRSVKQNGWNQSFNILEDQRIETMLTSLYPATIPYFVATFTRYCTDTPEAWENNYIIMYGRRYLPLEMREMFKTHFKYPKKLKKISKIIDEYRLLSFPLDNERGIELIDEFHKILVLLRDKSQQGSKVLVVNDPFGHFSDDRPDTTQGEGADGTEQKDVQDLVESLDDSLAQRDADEGGDVTKEDLEELSDSELEDLADEYGIKGTGTKEELIDELLKALNGEPSNDDDSDDGDVSDGEGGDDSKDDVKGSKTGNKTPTKATTQEIIDMLQGIHDDIMNNKDVMEDAKLKQDAIIDGDGDATVSDVKLAYTPMQPNREDYDVIQDFAIELKKLRAEHDPHWQKGFPTGRVNVRQLIKDAPYGELFDRRIQNVNDNNEIEAVILLDISDSMATKMLEASRSLWIIKSALEEINANVTVVAFNAGGVFLCYDRHEKTEWDSFRLFRQSGGTDPFNAITKSIDVFNASERGNKICFFITDGQWFNYERSDALVSKMNDAEIHTALAYIGGAMTIDTHNCNYAKRISKPEELIYMAMDIATKTFITDK